MIYPTLLLTLLASPALATFNLGNLLKGLPAEINSVVSTISGTSGGSTGSSSILQQIPAVITNVASAISGTGGLSGGSNILQQIPSDINNVVSSVAGAGQSSTGCWLTNHVRGFGKSCGNGFKGFGPLCLGVCPTNLPHRCVETCMASAASCSSLILSEAVKGIESVVQAAATGNPIGLVPEALSVVRLLASWPKCQVLAAGSASSLVAALPAVPVPSATLVPATPVAEQAPAEEESSISAPAITQPAQNEGYAAPTAGTYPITIAAEPIATSPLPTASKCYLST